MAELTSIKYAESLMDASEELGKTDEAQKELNELNDLFKANPDLFAFYTSPQVNKEEKKRMLKSIFADQLSPITLNLLFVLLDKKRSMEFYGIVKQYNRLVSDKRNEAFGTIYLARPCSEAVIEKLEKKLSAVIGKTLKLKVSIDPSIVGGIKIKIGDSIVDATVAAKLREMKGTIDSIIL